VGRAAVSPATFCVPKKLRKKGTAKTDLELSHALPARHAAKLKVRTFRGCLRAISRQNKPAALEILTKRNSWKKSAGAGAKKTIRLKSESLCQKLHWFSGDFFKEFPSKFLQPRFFSVLFLLKKKNGRNGSGQPEPDRC
jgi:hypothetical protein